LSALLYTYVFAEKYRATTTILYRPNPESQFEGLPHPQKTMGFPVPMTMPFEALGLTIKRVGTSERILRPVVVDLGLDKKEPNERTGLSYLYYEVKTTLREFVGDVWQFLKYGRVIEENLTSSAILGLAANTSIDTTQKNYTATLTVVDKDPIRAARIVDR